MTEWHVYIDGASLGNPGPSGAGIIAFDEGRREIGRQGVHLGVMTNNMAEYEALVRALRHVRDLAGRTLYIYTDSQLVANHILGKYRLRNEGLRPYFEEALRLIRNFPHIRIQYIPREQNRLADRLAKDAASGKGVDAWSRDASPEESPGIEGQDGP